MVAPFRDWVLPCPGHGRDPAHMSLKGRFTDDVRTRRAMVQILDLRSADRTGCGCRGAPAARAPLFNGVHIAPVIHQHRCARRSGPTPPPFLLDSTTHPVTRCA